MNKLEKKLFFWNSASRGGVFIGVILVLGIVMGYLVNNPTYNGYINNIATFLGFIGGGYIFGKRFSKGYGKEEISFVKALSFVFVMILLSGVIYGIAIFVMYNYVAPDFYRAMYDEVLRSANFSKEFTQQMELSYALYTGNPLVTVLSSIFNMAIFGILPALIIASFIKRGAIKDETNL